MVSKKIGPEELTVLLVVAHKTDAIQSSHHLSWVQQTFKVEPSSQVIVNYYVN